MAERSVTLVGLKLCCVFSNLQYYYYFFFFGWRLMQFNLNRALNNYVCARASVMCWFTNNVDFWGQLDKIKPTHTYMYIHVRVCSYEQLNHISCQSINNYLPHFILATTVASLAFTFACNEAKTGNLAHMFESKTKKNIKIKRTRQHKIHI